MPRIRTLKPSVQSIDLRRVSSAMKAETYGQGRGGRPWRRRRWRILVRDAFTCYVCGAISDQLEVDHVTPLSQGGTDDDANLKAICPDCHKAKTAREAAEARGLTVVQPPISGAPAGS